MMPYAPEFTFVSIRFAPLANLAVKGPTPRARLNRIE